MKETFRNLPNGDEEVFQQLERKRVDSDEPHLRVFVSLIC